MYLPGALQGSGTSTVAGKEMLVSAFLGEVAQQDYTQAYSRLSIVISTEITPMEFTRLAQADDRCYGVVTHATEVAHSAKMQNDQFSVVYTITRQKFPHLYSLSFMLQQESESGDWLISRIGDAYDVGPAPPTC